MSTKQSWVLFVFACLVVDQLNDGLGCTKRLLAVVHLD